MVLDNKTRREKLDAVRPARNDETASSFVATIIDDIALTAIKTRSEKLK